MRCTASTAAAHYLFTVKGNQSTLRTALARLPWASAPGLRERNVGHGRIESRSIKVIELHGAPSPPGALVSDGRSRTSTRGHATSLRAGAARLVDPGIDFRRREG